MFFPCVFASVLACVLAWVWCVSAAKTLCFLTTKLGSCQNTWFYLVFLGFFFRRCCIGFPSKNLAPAPKGFSHRASYSKESRGRRPNLAGDGGRLSCRLLQRSAAGRHAGRPVPARPHRAREPPRRRSALLGAAGRHSMLPGGASAIQTASPP